MLDAAGTIIALDEESGKYAVVRIDDGGCGRCHEPGGCGGANIGRMLCTTPRDFRALNPQGVALGARVRVAIADGAVRRGALTAYALPLLALLVGAMAGSAIAGDLNRDAGGIVGALVGLVAGWLPLWRGAAGKAGDPALQAVIHPLARER